MSQIVVPQLEDVRTARSTPQPPSSPRCAQHLHDADQEAPQPCPPQNVPQSARETKQSQRIWSVDYPAKAKFAMLGLILGMISLTVTVVGLAPSFRGEQFGKTSADLDIWQAKVTFRQWCQDEHVAGRNLTTDCADALEQSLPPPPISKRIALNGTMISTSSGRFELSPKRQDLFWGKGWLVSGSILIILVFFSRKHINRSAQLALIHIFHRIHRVDVLPLFSRRGYHGLGISQSPPSSPTVRHVEPPPKRSQTPLTSHLSNMSLLDLVFQDTGNLTQQQASNRNTTAKTMIAQSTRNIVKKRTTDQHHSMGTVPRSTVDSYIVRATDPDDADKFDTPVLTKEIWNTFNKRTMLEAEKAFLATAEDHFVIGDQDHHDWTSLHLAAARGDVRSVKELLEGGSDVNAQDAMGRTALYLAVLRDHEEVVRTLLERGAGI